LDGLDLRVAPTSLRQAWARLGVDVESDAMVTGITVDSGDVRSGMVFAALQGQHTHGARFAEDAAARGAAAFLTDEPGAALLAGSPSTAVLPRVVVADPRARVGELSAALYGHPARRLLTFGVTGTNGKTTTTWLLEAVLRAAGHRCGVLGTLGIRLDGDMVATSRTTPEAPQLQGVLAHLVRHGADSAALEVSSHALQLGRVDGLVVDVAGFTNLAQDHLDFHGSMAEYESAKQRLFTPEHSRRAVVVDSGAGRRVATAATVPVELLAVDEPSGDGRRPRWRVEVVGALAPVGLQVRLTFDDDVVATLDVHLPGLFNVANASLAAAMALTAGIDREAVEQGIATFAGVPGRMEVVDRGQPFVAIVDYAHTPDALDAVLRDLRGRRLDGRLIVVFGCGGDRDTAKRPVMGRVAAQLADVVVVTDDNPRSEDPAAIRAAVLAGARAAGADADVLEVGDRSAAIATAVAVAAAGDTLVVAGKGHEPGQQVGDVMLPFDDRSALAAALDAEGNERT
jgi:UDP-N-acetylmuramoyl-L-alanyl-D-glutamate--2,6-diaminopimelate ligase